VYWSQNHCLARGDVSFVQQVRVGDRVEEHFDTESYHSFTTDPAQRAEITTLTTALHPTA
jgi:hypothetical protein